MLPRSVLVSVLAALALWLSSGAAHAQDLHAQPHKKPPVADAVAVSPTMPARVRLRLMGAGAGGAALGLTVAVGLAALTEAIHAQPSGFAALALVPFISTMLVERAGSRAGYAGDGGRAFVGALGGMALGVAVTVTMLVWSSYSPRMYAPAVACGALSVVTSVAGFSTLAYRRTAERRLNVTPQLAVARREFSVGLTGRF